MGRKSHLSQEQWATLGKRLLEGESLDALAKEYGIARQTISSHFSRKGQSITTVQQVAGKMYEAECALRALPTEAQVEVLTLVKRLRNISESLALAAENSAKTAVRFSALANSEAQKVDDAEPGKAASVDCLKNSVLLTKAANEAAHIPLNLLSANRETVKRMNEEGENPGESEDLTPERLVAGARRIAFTLHRAATLQPKEKA